MSQTTAILATTRPMKFLGVTQRISNKTTPARTYNIAKFADAEKFENFDFFLNDEQIMQINGLSLHDAVDVSFDLTVSNGRPAINLNTIKKASIPVGSK